MADQTADHTMDTRDVAPLIQKEIGYQPEDDDDRDAHGILHETEIWE